MALVSCWVQWLRWSFHSICLCCFKLVRWSTSGRLQLHQLLISSLHHFLVIPNIICFTNLLLSILQICPNSCSFLLLLVPVTVVCLWTLSPTSTSVSSDFMVLCKCSLKIILTSLYFVEGLAWWDWPFTWYTDQLLSFSAWHCWLGYLTRKNRPRYDI